MRGEQVSAVRFAAALGCQWRHGCRRSRGRAGHLAAGPWGRRSDGHPFMAAMASGLAGTGWRVVRIGFPSMARMRETGRRQGPDRMPVLEKALRQQVQLEKTEQPGRPIIIGGKSMVGRVASLLVDELAASDGVRGCLCLGYPFNPPGPSGHGRRWRAMPSQPRFSCSGSSAATTASNPPRAWASARRGTGPRPLITLSAFCGNT